LVEQDNVAAITKSSSEKHCLDALKIFDFELTPEDYRAIDQLDTGRRLIDPSWSPAWDEASMTLR
jgi:diketogulonate reductase-like aldo/keto reductase